MEYTDFQKKIGTILPRISFAFQEPMARHTSFRIGGPVEVMAFPKSEAELAECLTACRKLAVRPMILGAGTNVLAPDAGMPGLVICLKDCLSGMERSGDATISVRAGVTMSRAAVFAAAQGLSGLEFAHGIPGTVGGGVYMNAGAYGGEIAQVCTAVTILDPDGRLHRCSGRDMHFSYRHSILEETGGIVVSTEFTLTHRPEAEIRETMRQLMGRRRASQPLELPSAGSAFKRPPQGYAAALIEQAGLKGFRIGGAAVSEKHAGFVVNLGDATAADVQAVLREVARQVEETSGTRLEPEIRIW